MNAADYYGLDELRKACIGFVSCCITVDTVCTLLASAERYIQYKCTKSLVQRVSYHFFVYIVRLEKKATLTLLTYTVDIVINAKV